MVAIGPHTLPNNLVLAPMAGVTDRPFRLLCRRMGAGLAISEMVTADASLWSSRKSRQRMDHDGEPEPIAVQIAGGDAPMLAEAARFNVANGARIIDMGCPAKKVCSKAGQVLRETGEELPDPGPDKAFRRHFNGIEDAGEQLQLLDHYFQGIQTEEVRVA